MVANDCYLINPNFLINTLFAFLTLPSFCPYPMLKQGCLPLVPGPWFTPGALKGGSTAICSCSAQAQRVPHPQRGQHSTERPPSIVMAGVIPQCHLQHHKPHWHVMLCICPLLFNLLVLQGLSPADCW